MTPPQIVISALALLQLSWILYEFGWSFFGPPRLPRYCRWCKIRKYKKEGCRECFRVFV